MLITSAARPAGVFVADAQRINENGQGTWLGWKSDRGWVFFDRKAKQNQGKPSNYWFVQASDWSAYCECSDGYQRGTDPCYYASHLAQLDENQLSGEMAEITRLCFMYERERERILNHIDRLVEQEGEIKRKNEFLAQQEAMLVRRRLEEQQDLERQNAQNALNEALRFPKEASDSSSQYQAGFDKDGQYTFDRAVQPLDQNVCLLWDCETRKYDVFESRLVAKYVKTILDLATAQRVISTYMDWYTAHGDRWRTTERSALIGSLIVPTSRTTTEVPVSINTFGHRYRVAHCWRCREHLDSALNRECSACGWLKCSCGACGCGRG